MRLAVLLVCLGVTAAGVYLWLGVGRARDRRMPQPPAAQLPASVRELLPKPHQDSLDLTVPPHQQLDYRVGMQAGATVVYAWSTAHSGEVLSGEFPGNNVNHGSDGRGALEAESSGWYHWRWRNSGARPVAIRFKLSGYYELMTTPPAGMPYDR